MFNKARKFLLSFENKEAILLFFKFLNELITELLIKPENEKLSISYQHNEKRINVSLNSRLVLSITGKSEIVFIVNTADFPTLPESLQIISTDTFDRQNPKATLARTSYEQLALLQDFIIPLFLRSCSEYEPVQTKSQYRHSHMAELYEYAINPALQKALYEADAWRMLIEEYKSVIRKGGLIDEVYKWALLQKYQGRPNTTASDFKQEFNKVDYSNLLYQMSKVVSKNILKEDPELYRKCFIDLFDEQLKLADRIETFSKTVNKIYSDMGQTLSTHHDERTAATFLTYHNPDNFTFYKSSYYLEFCYFVDETSKNTGTKYIHYLSLIDRLVNEYILNDAELLQLVDAELSKLPDSFPDVNRKILAQDMFYQLFDKYETEPSYWVFQANPSYYDTERALKAGVLKTWRVSQYKKDIKIGDKVILWITGDKAGIYALATVNSDVHLITDTPEELPFYIDNSEVDEAIDGVELTLEHNLIESPIMKVTVLSNPILKELKQGIQGTNLKATEKQYNAILEIIRSEIPKGLDDLQTPLKNMKRLNQILYGPPGTGKTYNTINMAIEIVNPNFDLKQDRKLIKQEFERLKKDGQIVFTTFHQSMSYEDFIEGIKPETLNDKVVYSIQNGIFKSICQTAQTPNQLDFNQAYENLKIEIVEKEILYLKTPTGKEFAVSVNSNGNLHLLTGPNKEQQGTLTKENIQKLIDGDKLDYWGGYFNGVIKYIEDNYGYSRKIKTQNQNFVLIIDEINRGNVSQIFGELITLIEDDKRLGKAEALEVILPYSKEKFGVPANLYIIGTMNTADRSVEALDAALRRRFSFVEMTPKPELVANQMDGISLSKVLETINKRIEVLLDKDHQIGHSYFMSVETSDDLKSAFKNKIIPLLQEYFFGDYGKIGLVLGSSFVSVEKNTDSKKLFASFDDSYDASDLGERAIYNIVDVEYKDFDFQTAIKSLLNN